MTTYVLSLQEAVLFVKDRMRRFHTQTNKEFKSDGMKLLFVMDYPTTNFMQVVCDTIFHTPSSQDGGADYKLETAERILGSDGLIHTLVTDTTRRAFEMCVDVLASHLPDLSFQDDTLATYRFLNELDIELTIPEKQGIDQYLARHPEF